MIVLHRFREASDRGRIAKRRSNERRFRFLAALQQVSFRELPRLWQLADTSVTCQRHRQAVLSNLLIERLMRGPLNRVD